MKKHILLSATLVAAMTISFQASAWKPSVLFAVESESEHQDPTWDHNSGTAVTTGIIAGYLEEGNYTFDASYAQSYTSAKSAYKKNQNNIGVTYRNTYDAPFGGGGDFSFRVAYRGENISNNPSSKGAYSDKWRFGDLKSNEQRNEYWLVPTANYKFNKNIRVQGSYTYRYIDRQQTFYKTIDQGAIISPTTRSSASDIQSGYAGLRYTFDTGVSDFSRNFIEANYYFVKENLKGTLYNDEKFLWVRGYVPYKVKGYIGGISPYMYWAFDDAERKYYFSNGSLRRIDEANRSRYGVRISQNMQNNWSIALDTYYSPRTQDIVFVADPGGCVPDVNKGPAICTANPQESVGPNKDFTHSYVYAYLELTKRF